MLIPGTSEVFQGLSINTGGRFVDLNSAVSSLQEKAIGGASYRDPRFQGTSRSLTESRLCGKWLSAAQTLKRR
jgi:hypothetical protein